MEPNLYLILILSFITLSFLLDFAANWLNLKALTPYLPQELSDLYDKKTYFKSQQYLKENTKLDLFKTGLSTILTILFIITGGFNFIDKLARSFAFNEIATGIIFISLLILIKFIFDLPFSIYETFIIESKYGFNKTTPKIFITDIIKGLLLAAALGLPLIAAILWFFETVGPNAWIYCWIGVTLYMIVIQFLAPALIMPLFNKFSPLPDGELKEQILEYANKENFRVKGVFTMDGSKRSSKLNAFFAGFGRFRRIVLFDTLIEKLKTSEIVAVLAHEMGHFKLKHIQKMMALSITQTGLMFFLLSLFLGNQALSKAFGMEQPSIYSSLVFFGFLYTPINILLGIAFNYFSRQWEFEADAYAAKDSKLAVSLISALKKLSAENLSNLTPHKLYVVLYYSHPPILARIQALKRFIHH